MELALPQRMDLHPHKEDGNQPACSIRSATRSLGFIRPVRRNQRPAREGPYAPDLCNEKAVINQRPDFQSWSQQSSPLQASRASLTTKPTITSEVTASTHHAPSMKSANRPTTTTSDSQPQVILSAASARMARLPSCVASAFGALSCGGRASPKRYADAATADKPEALKFYNQHLNDSEMQGMIDLARTPVTHWPSLEAYANFKRYWYFSLKFLKPLMRHAVDRSTGTIVARATIGNADLGLLPGQYVRIRLAIGTEPDALMVPEAALGSSQLGKYVYVVGEGNKVDQRLVSLGPSDGGLVAVLKGVSEGERVINGNLQKIGPGALVQPLLQ
jgi:hypothetical protein